MAFGHIKRREQRRQRQALLDEFSEGFCRDQVARVLGTTSAALERVLQSRKDEMTTEQVLREGEIERR